MTRDYELGFILNPEVSEEETRATIGRVEQIVANHGGQIVRVNQWGRRRLAYPIERHRDGFYVFIDMILTPETVLELERTLKVSEIVLRHMVIRRDPKAVQQEREEREEREARAAAAAASAADAAATPAPEAEPAVATEDQEAQVPTDEAVQELPEIPDEDFSEVSPAPNETETVEAQ